MAMVVHSHSNCTLVTRSSHLAATKCCCEEFWVPGRAAKPSSPSLSSSWQDVKEQAESQAAGLTCVPNDVVQHHQPLELQQQLPVSVLWERLSFKLPQPVVSILVAFHEELEGTHLKQGEVAL